MEREALEERRRTAQAPAQAANNTVNNHLKTDPYELRAELEDFFDRFSLFGAQESAIVPFDVQFDTLVSAYTTDAISQALLLTYPPFVDDNDDSPLYTGRLPIHLACDTGAPLSVIEWLIRHDVDKRSIRTPDKWGDLPLHTACARRGYTAVIQRLLEADGDDNGATASTKITQTLWTRDVSGMLPLHMACRYNLPAEAIRLLLAVNDDNNNDADDDATTTAQQRNTLLLTRATMNDQLPLHIAVRCDAPPSVVQVLLEHDTTYTSVLLEDSAQRIPLHIAFLRNPSQPGGGTDSTGTSSITLLLHYMFVGRLERSGMAQWRRDMSRMRCSMRHHERDFMTREKLDVIIAAMEEMMERVIVIELSVWKQACLQISDTVRVSTMEELEEQRNLLKNMGMESVSDYKQQRRIKCGAECIARNVMMFLENEPLEKYRAEFP